MGKYIETTYPIIDDRVNRWETLGMLNTVKSDDSKKLIAMALDATTIYVTDFKPININEDSKNCIIPVIVKIFNETNNDFTFETLTESVRDIIEDFTEKYNELKSNLNKSNIDYNNEIEFISQYCEKYSFN